MRDMVTPFMKVSTPLYQVRSLSQSLQKKCSRLSSMKKRRNSHMKNSFQKEKEFSSDLLERPSVKSQTDSRMVNKIASSGFNQILKSITSQILHKIFKCQSKSKLCRTQLLLKVHMNTTKKSWLRKALKVRMNRWKMRTVSKLSERRSWQNTTKSQQRIKELKLRIRTLQVELTLPLVQ